MKFQANRYDLIEVAQGKRPADLFLEGGRVINVYSGEILRQNVAIYKDRIAYVGESTASVGSSTHVIDAKEYYLSPGYIETHAHPWVIYNPVSLAGKALSLGTTTLVNDNLFFYLHMGEEGFSKMMEDLAALPLHQLWLVRIVSQADYPGERDWFHPDSVRRLLQSEHVIGTAEVTRWPLLYNREDFVIETVEYAKRLGKLSDGHNAGCSYEKLISIAASGISACHEAITVQEALDRLRLGLWTVLRNSSLRPDLPELAKLITEKKVDTRRILMTTDGPHPAFIDEIGLVDGLIREAVAHGIPPVHALQMVTINAATYLGLEEHLGGIAPGKRADLLLLPDLTTFRPKRVIARGQSVARDGRLTVSLPHVDWGQYMVREPFTISEKTLLDPNFYRLSVTESSQPVPVIHFRIAVITQRKDMKLPRDGHFVDISHHPSLAYAALIDRDGQWVSRGLLENFTTHIEGMASTYNTTTHLLVIGRNPEAMARAALKVKEMEGGIAIVENGKCILEIPLPLAGMMTTDPEFQTAVKYQNRLMDAVKARGYPFHDILYTMLFLTCDFLPGLRLTPYGVYEVKQDKVVHPCERLTKRVYT